MKQFLIVGLEEVPILNQYGEEKCYIMMVHIDTVEGINTAEEIALANSKKFEHGVEIKAVLNNI